MKMRNAKEIEEKGIGKFIADKFISAIRAEMNK